MPIPPGDDIKALRRHLRLLEVEAARARHPIDKMFEGPRLFDAERAGMMVGAALRMPGADHDAVNAEVNRLLDLRRKRDEEETRIALQEMRERESRLRRSDP